MRMFMVLCAFALILAPTAAAQPPLPLSVTVKYAGWGGDAVGIQGTALPGTVVSVKGATVVVGSNSTFSLRSTLPLSLVAVRAGQIRRLSLGLPSGATKWLAWLDVTANLTRMETQVAGALTITNHPPATVTVEHEQAGTMVQTQVTRGKFHLGFPIVPRTNTLDWTLHAGWINWSAPPLTFTVQ